MHNICKIPADEYAFRLSSIPYIIHNTLYSFENLIIYHAVYKTTASISVQYSTA